jgi:hypothetical protein
MSDELARRLTHVETGHQELRGDFRLLGQQVHGLQAQVSKIDGGIEDIKGVLAKRGEPASWRAVAGTLLALGGGVGMIATFVWWFIATSPAIQSLDRRVTRLDDPELGRVHRLEERDEETRRRIATLKGWEAVAERK